MMIQQNINHDTTKRAAWKTISTILLEDNTGNIDSYLRQRWKRFISLETPYFSWFLLIEC